MNKNKLRRALRTTIVAVTQAQLTEHEHSKLAQAKHDLLAATIQYLEALNDKPKYVEREPSMYSNGAVRVSD